VYEPMWQEFCQQCMDHGSISFIHISWSNMVRLFSKLYGPRWQESNRKCSCKVKIHI